MAYEWSDDGFPNSLNLTDSREKQSARKSTLENIRKGRKLRVAMSQEQRRLIYEQLDKMRRYVTKPVHSVNDMQTLTYGNNQKSTKSCNSLADMVKSTPVG